MEHTVRRKRVHWTTVLFNGSRYRPSNNIECFARFFLFRFIFHRFVAARHFISRPASLRDSSFAGHKKKLKKKNVTVC